MRATKTRSFNGIKAIGALIIFASIPACIVGLDSKRDGVTSMAFLMFLIGFTLFVIGRFRD